MPKPFFFDDAWPYTVDRIHTYKLKPSYLGPWVEFVERHCYLKALKIPTIPCALNSQRQMTPGHKNEIFCSKKATENFNYSCKWNEGTNPAITNTNSNKSEKIVILKKMQDGCHPPSS